MVLSLCRSQYDKFIKRYSETDPQAEQGPFNDLFGMKDEGLDDILGVSILCLYACHVCDA